MDMRAEEESEDTGDDGYVPQVRPYWSRNRRERIERRLDILFAGIAGAFLMWLILFKLWHT